MLPWRQTNDEQKVKTELVSLLTKDCVKADFRNKTKKWSSWVKFDTSLVHRQNWPLLCDEAKKWGLWVKFDASIVHRQN